MGLKCITGHRWQSFGKKTRFKYLRRLNYMANVSYRPNPQDGKNISKFFQTFCSRVIRNYFS